MHIWNFTPCTVPAGTSCPSLERIDNGGVIYTDLILSIGVIANYVCFNGFSLHGHGSYECSTDNQWIRTNDQSTWKNADVPTCESKLGNKLIFASIKS